jgi:hypothetical protein
VNAVGASLRGRPHRRVKLIHQEIETLFDRCGRPRRGTPLQRLTQSLKHGGISVVIRRGLLGEAEVPTAVKPEVSCMVNNLLYIYPRDLPARAYRDK